MMMGQRKSGMMELMFFMRKLRNHLQLLQTRRLAIVRGVQPEEVDVEETVPDDVKEGHFAVLAAENEEGRPIRFVVKLCVLKHPAFLKLLDLAEEEYGFEQKGALAVPCRPDELQMILHEYS